MTLEVWADVIGYEGLYEVSDIGRVRSTRRPGAKGGLKTCGIQHLGYGKGLPYRTVDLYKKNVRETLLVHRLVALAFVSNATEGNVVRHNDNDSLNNCSDNLVWGNHDDNMQDMKNACRHHNSKKTHCPKGHEYTQLPLGRVCYTCNNEGRRKKR